MLRAVCVFVAVALLVWICLALIDSQFLVPDAVRWAIGGAGYLIAAFVAWITALRFLFGTTGQRELAQLIESTDPSFREELISAVELSDPTGEEAAKYDSEAFRSRVQADVADHVRGMNVRNLLPFQRVAGDVTAALIGLVMLIGLLFVPGLQFGRFFQRAALPLLNLARPSEIGITVVTPTPADRSVPEFDSIQLLVETDGPPVDRVLLEIVDAETGRTKTEMRRERNGRYSAEIPMEQANVRYRVRAKNSITRYYELTPRERPRVTNFSKTYQYPEYTRLPEKTVEESVGDGSAVEDTIVHLDLTTNEKVDAAELRLESSSSDIENQPIPLTVSANGHLHGQFPVVPEFTAYRVHLVAEPDSVTNKFSPLYEMRSVVDQSPRITMTDPTEGREMFTDEVLPVVGSATDDFGLTRVAYVWRVDGKEWHEVTIPIEDNAREQTLVTEFDLAGADIDNAQLLVLKLIAIDGRGNVAETTPVSFALRQRMQNLAETKKEWTEKKVALAKEVHELARQIRETERDSNQARNALKKKPEDRAPQEQLDVAELADAARENKERAERVREQFKKAIRQAPNRVEEEALMAAARVASKVEHELLEPLAKQLEQAASEQPPRNEPRDAANRANEAAWKTEQLAKRMQTLAAADRAAEIADDAGRLSERQDDLASDAREEQKRNSASPEEEQALQDRQDFNELAAEKLQEELKKLAEVTPTGEKGRAAHVARELEHKAKEAAKREAQQQSRLEIEPNREKAEKLADEHLAKIADQTKNNWKHAERQAEQIAKALAGHAARAREELLRESLETTPDLEDLKRLAEHVANEKQRNAVREIQEKQQERLEQVEEELEHKLSAVAEQLRDNAELEEQRDRPDHRSAADQSLLARALEALEPKPRQASETSPDDMAEDMAENPSEAERKTTAEQQAEEAKERAEKLADVEQAREALEADSQARNLAKSLDELAENEADANQFEALRDQPAAWQEVKERMQQLPNALKEADVDKEAVERASKLKDSKTAKQLDEEMRRRNREQQSEKPKTREMESELAQLAKAAKQQQDAAAPEAQSAREALGEMAPSIPDRAEELAEQLADQSEQNKDASEKAEQREATPQENAVAANDAAEENAASNEQLDELLDDLRREANAADLGDDEAREKARDADDALAEMAQEDAGDQAQEALENAAEGEGNPDQQAADLAEAAKQQSELSDKLAEMAEQLNNPDKGREQLREQESQSEQGEQIAQDFDRAEDLADILDEADEDAGATLAELEEELKNNPAMQEALADIANDAVSDAAGKIQEAAKQESKLAETTSEQAKGKKELSEKETAQAEKKQAGINEGVGDAAEDLARASRHQERLENMEASQAAGQLAEATEQAAEGELAEAAEALADQAPIQEVAKEVDQADTKLDQLADSAEAMAEQQAATENAKQAAAESASPPIAPSPSASQQAASQSGDPSAGPPQGAQPEDESPSSSPPPAPTPAEMAQAQALAEALDRLDQALAAAESAKPTQAAEQSALSSLSKALAAQSESMAQSRAERGEAAPPGEPSMAQQAEDANDPSQSPQSSAVAKASPKDALPADASVYEELAGYEVTEAELRDWGKLPPQVAKEILESRRDGVSPEYRSAIESYYQALGERARSQ